MDALKNKMVDSFEDLPVEVTESKKWSWMGDFRYVTSIYVEYIFWVTIGYLCITHYYFCVNLVLEM